MNQKVYLIQCGNFFKVGISKQPKRRLKEIQTCNPLPCRIIGTKSVEDAVHLERFIHSELTECNSSGEWFELQFRHLSWMKNELGFDFSYSIESILTETPINHVNEDLTKQIRARNSEVDTCVFKFESIFGCNIKDRKKIRRVVIKYGISIVSEAIDVLEKKFDSAEEAYQNISSYSAKVNKKVNDPGLYVSDYLSAICYHRFRDSLVQSDREILKSSWEKNNMNVGVDETCKIFSRMANSHDNARDFLHETMKMMSNEQ